MKSQLLMVARPEPLLLEVGSDVRRSGTTVSGENARVTLEPAGTPSRLLRFAKPSLQAAEQQHQIPG